MSKLIIATTLPNSGKGGISTAAFNAIQILLRNGFEVCTVVTHSPNNGKFGNFIAFLASVFKLIALKRNKDTLLLHVGPRGSLIRKLVLAGVGRTLGLQVLTVYHSPLFYEYIAQKGILKILLLLLSRVSTTNIALNAYWRDFFQENLKQYFSVLHNPIVVEHDFEKREAPTEPNRIQVVTVARLVKEKNVQTVIEFAKRNRSVDLTIIGDGPYRAALEAEAAPIAERISFLGWLPQQSVMKLVFQSDVFVLPSMYDSFGMVYVESLAVGTPVVAPSLAPVVDTLKELPGVAFADDPSAIFSALSLVRPVDRTVIRNAALERFGEAAFICSFKKALQGGDL